MKLTHGSERVEYGKLKGATGDTDYFHFFCPRCPDDWVLRILDFEIMRDEAGNEYNADCMSESPRTFTILFTIFCERCRFKDCVKISNDTWQGGKHAVILGETDSGSTSRP